MQRKLIRLSPSTMVVSLPSPWLKKMKLAKGDAINVKETENSILLSTTKAKSYSSITIDLGSLSRRLMWAHIDASYIAGYDEITFLTPSPLSRTVVHQARNEVPGMIIVEQTVKSTRYKDITGSSRENIDSIVNRIFNMIITLVCEGLALVQTKQWKELPNLKKHDYAINSYISYCHRQITKFGYRDFSKTGLLATYLKLLEIISDEICDIFAQTRPSLALLERNLDILRQFQRLHEKFATVKVSALEKTFEEQNTLHDLFFSLLEVEIQIHT